MADSYHPGYDRYDRPGADRYDRPPQYDRSRRGSSPGRSWSREQADHPPTEPRRPTNPQRSFSTMNPRQSGYSIHGAADARKRGASKSPDGALARKQQKPEAPQESDVTRTNQDHSRRASIPNGVAAAPRPNSNGQSPQPHPQRPPVAPMRKPSDGAVLSSPRSPLESATSGRSTPQNRPSNLSKDTTGQVPNGVAAPPVALDLDSMSLTDLLVKLSSDIATRAALEYERNQARDLLSSAQREYNEMKKHFKSYPAIEERKNEDKKAALEALKAKEKLLSEQTATQQTVAQGIASILSQLATPKPNPDMVSRAEHDSLKQELKQQEGTILRLREGVSNAKRIADQANSQSGQVPMFQSDIGQLKRDSSTLLSWKRDAETRFDGLVTFGQRLGAVETRSTSTKDAFDSFMKDKAGDLASKKDVNGLDTRIQDVQRAQAKAAAEKMNAHAKNQSVDPFSDARFQKLVDGQEKHAEEIKNLQLGGNKVFVDVQTKIDKVALAQDAVSQQLDTVVEKQDTMTQTLDQLGSDIVASKEDINVIYDSIEEEGKDTIVKRVKRLDHLVNNLSSKLGDSSDSATNKRLAQLEKDCKALQQAASSTRTIPQPQSNPQTSTSNTHSGGLVMNPDFTARLDSLQNQLDSFKREQDELDEILESQITHAAMAQKDVMMDKISQHLSAARSEDARVYSKALEDAVKDLKETDTKLTTAVQALEEAVHSKTSNEAMESLKGTVSSISEDIKKLQAQHQRTKSMSQAPAQPNGVFHGAQQSSLPNGVSGSPQVNSPHQPHSPFAAPHAQSQPGQISVQAQQLQDMQNQINGLINVVQHIKVRCDNLQTDDVVRAMLEQFNSIYPDAKNINSTIGTLRGQVASVLQQMSVLQQNKANPSAEPSEDIRRAIAKADGANTSAQSVSQDLQRLRTEINTIREAVRSLEKTAPSASSSGSDPTVKGQLSTLRTELDKTTTIAREADRLSKQHSSRFSKIQPEELKTRVATLEGTVEEHGRTIKTGEDAFKEVNEQSASIKSGLNRVKKTLAAHDKRITDMEAD